MSCLLNKQKHGLILLMSAIVTIAGLLAVISLSVVLVQINTTQCHVCDDHVSGGLGKKLDEVHVHDCLEDYISEDELLP